MLGKGSERPFSLIIIIFWNEINLDKFNFCFYLGHVFCFNFMITQKVLLAFFLGVVWGKELQYLIEIKEEEKKTCLNN